jgi:hypothetical protein
MSTDTKVKRQRFGGPGGKILIPDSEFVNEGLIVRVISKTRLEVVSNANCDKVDHIIDKSI